jgi:hypothetical protein
MRDRNNFQFRLGVYAFLMQDSVLTVNGIGYDPSDADTGNDPTYAMARRIAYDAGQINDIEPSEFVVDTIGDDDET